MKMLLCADMRLGALCAESLDIDQAHRWQAARSEAFAGRIDLALQKHAGYLALFGRLFGQERVSESLIDAMFETLREEPEVQVLAFLSADEYRRLSYRNDIPPQMHLICVEPDAEKLYAGDYLDDAIAIRAAQGCIELQLGEHDALTIQTGEEGVYSIRGLGTGSAGPCVIPALEPAGFEEAQTLSFGYGILEWTEEQPGTYRCVSGQKYAFETLEVKILPEDDEQEILRKIDQPVRKLDRDTFLRLTLFGRSAFGLTINSDALQSRLQNRVFFARVYDNTVMDIDEAAFENDISLRSEFVRLALQDDTLSESERSRLISCGWNALGGEGVREE